MATTRTCDECGKEMKRDMIGDGLFEVRGSLPVVGGILIFLTYGYGKTPVSANGNRADICVDCMTKSGLTISVAGREGPPS